MGAIGVLAQRVLTALGAGVAIDTAIDIASDTLLDDYPSGSRSFDLLPSIDLTGRRRKGRRRRRRKALTADDERLMVVISNTISKKAAETFIANRTRRA